MIETITAIVRQYLTDEGLAVTEESNLKEDLGLDSFDIMNILIFRLNISRKPFKFLYLLFYRFIFLCKIY